MHQTSHGPGPGPDLDPYPYPGPGPGDDYHSNCLVACWVENLHDWNWAYRNTVHLCKHYEAGYRDADGGLPMVGGRLEWKAASRTSPAAWKTW